MAETSESICARRPSEVSLKGTARTTRWLCGPGRRACVLWLVDDIDRYIIEEEIAIRMARHVDDPQAEVGVDEK
jgi:hypothetical protein